MHFVPIMVLIKCMKSWDNVTVGSLIKIVELSTNEMDAIDKQVAVLSVFTGKTPDELLDMPKDKFLKLSEKYKWAADLPQEMEVKSFECGGYTWVPQRDITKISLGQYIDLTELLKQPVKNIPAMLATLSTPYKHYPLFIKVKKDLDFKEKERVLHEAKASDAYSLSLFFCRVLIHFTNAMQGSLEKGVKETMKKARKTGGRGSRS